MPKNPRKKYAPEFKFKLVEESLKTGNATATARRYSVSFNLLSKWRMHFREKGREIFETNNDKEKKDLRKKVARLEQLVGKKEVELNLLKNFSDFYESRKQT